MKQKITKLAGKMLAMIFVMALVLSMAACSGGDNKNAGNTGDTTDKANAGNEGGSDDAAGNSDVAVVQHKIGVGLYTDSGKSVEAIKAYLDGIADTVGCDFVYTTLSTYDEATNKTKIQELISAGCEGIIMTMDLGTASILEECEKAGVYMAGYLCDFNTSYQTAFDDIFGSDYFLGTVCDGWADQSDWGVMIAEDIIAAGHKNVGVLTFPDYAYPNQADVDAAFRAVIETHNETASDDDKITLIETEVLNFAPLEATYLSNNPDLDAIYSICAGASNVYPTLVAAGKTNIKLYTTGFEGTDDVDNFGLAGNGCYQGIMFSSPEAIVYPLCLLIDQLNGTTYADLPAVSERVDCSEMIISSDEEMNTIKEKSLYYTGNYADAFVSAQDVKNLCASYNSEATYAQLVATVQSMSVEDLQNK